MTVIEGLRSYLLANGSIAAMVSSRIFPLRLPQKVDLSAGKGAIVLNRITDIGQAHLRGVNATSRARIQVDAYAASHDDATALGSLVAQRIDGYQGTWTDGNSPASVIRVQGIVQDMEGDRFEEDINGGLCRHTADYFVTYVEVGAAILI